MPGAQTHLSFNRSAVGHDAAGGGVRGALVVGRAGLQAVVLGHFVCQEPLHAGGACGEEK